MKEIIKHAVANRIADGKNTILNRSLETEIREDKIIKIIIKEVTDYTVRLFKSKNKNN
jgi:hypothetical protein